jgi:galactokinase/mevalonate kinase-like predicted kinase
MEEALLLVDSGSTRESGAATAGLAGGARDLRDALVEARFGDVGSLVSREWKVRKERTPGISTAEIDALVALVEGAGGAGWGCGRGPGGLVAVWAPPGERGPGVREAVIRALGEAGARPFPARVDLLGLDLA